MPSDFDLAIQGDLGKHMAAEKDLVRRAEILAIREGAMALQQDLRGETSEALGARVGNAWRLKFFPRRSGGTVGFIYSRAAKIVSAFNADTVILPKHGRFLAIPTNFNRKGGHKSGDPVVTPAQMIKSAVSFVRPSKGEPGLVWFLNVARGQVRNKGKVKDRAYAGGIKLLGSGRRKQTEEAIERRAIPMFLLLPKVRLRQRLHIDAKADTARRDMPERLSRAFAELDQGTRP